MCLFFCQRCLWVNPVEGLEMGEPIQPRQELWPIGYIICDIRNCLLLSQTIGPLSSLAGSSSPGFQTVSFSVLPGEIRKQIWDFLNTKQVLFVAIPLSYSPCPAVGTYIIVGVNGQTTHYRKHLLAYSICFPSLKKKKVSGHPRKSKIEADEWVGGIFNFLILVSVVSPPPATLCCFYRK